MTPEQLAQTPAATPPPGVQPNFVNPPSGAPVVISVSSVLMVIMFMLAGLRFYVKLALRRKVTPDDWATLAAVIGTCWYYAICIHGTAALTHQQKKLGVIAVFTTGLMACVASSISIYFKHRLNSHLGDYTYWIYPVLLMALVEISASKDFEGSWQSMEPHANERVQYVDLEMEGNKTHNLAYAPF
ncbi:hypothetical protein SLS53_001640 [Cytospora paraplurivora]|uniref:Integral membrane protein n=1 Tax=Cytospora paraplurivora TaxID=2898453 RepID=A0AAN9UGF0_9PEZI